MVVGCGFGADHDLADTTARIRGIDDLDNIRVTHSYDPDRLQQSPPSTFCRFILPASQPWDYHFSNVCLAGLSMNRGPDAPGEDHPPKPEAAKPMLNAAYLSAAFPPADAARRAGRQFLG